MALLAQGVGRRLGLRAHELHEVVRAAELHDIGKMAIPDAILAKPGPLDAVEWEFIRQHTIVGERMLHMAPALAGVARLVRWSHERVDGGGYPDGLVGDEIPLGARIVAVSDAFNAMISDRPYRRAVSAEEAVAELLRHSGTQFDAEVVAAFQAEILGAGYAWAAGPSRITARTWSTDSASHGNSTSHHVAPAAR